MPIRTYLEDHSAFQPGEIDAMSRALEEVCKTLNINGDARHRETIAARIIDLARSGVRDAKALSERVLAEAKIRPEPHRPRRSPASDSRRAPG
jgi:hypothetical protein